MPFRLTPVNLASLIQPSPTNESCYLLYRSRKPARLTSHCARRAVMEATLRARHADVRSGRTSEVQPPLAVNAAMGRSETHKF